MTEVSELQQSFIINPPALYKEAVAEAAKLEALLARSSKNVKMRRGAGFDATPAPSRASLMKFVELPDGALMLAKAKTPAERVRALVEEALAVLDLATRRPRAYQSFAGFYQAQRLAKDALPHYAEAIRKAVEALPRGALSAAHRSAFVEAARELGAKKPDDQAVRRSLELSDRGISLFRQRMVKVVQAVGAVVVGGGALTSLGAMATGAFGGGFALLGVGVLGFLACGLLAIAADHAVAKLRGERFSVGW